MKPVAKVPAVPLRRGIFWLAQRLFRRRDFSFEWAWCELLCRRRLALPQAEIGLLFPEDPVAVRVAQFPRGGWSSPVVDLVMLSHIVASLKPVNALELGSFRGYTAAAIAEHLPPQGRLVAVDIEPSHGEAYRDTLIANKIERRVGAIGPDIFTTADTASFDLIFLDADHRYEAVASDTQQALPLLNANGWFIWHDYANWGFFSGACGVPEFLNTFGASHPVLHLSGSNMVVYRPYWETPAGRKSYLKLVESTQRAKAGDPWRDGLSRS